MCTLAQHLVTQTRETGDADARDHMRGCFIDIWEYIAMVTFLVGLRNSSDERREVAATLNEQLMSMESLTSLTK